MNRQQIIFMAINDNAYTMNKGIFITFEGPDCAGKTTQLKLLEKWFKDNGREVICTREPGGTPMAEKIRNMLLSIDNSEKMTMEAELLLFGAARAQHVANVISPMLDKGGVVLCDRFYDSTTAYQGYGRGIDIEFIDRLNAFCTAGRAPDLTFLMDLPLAESRKRLALRRGEQADRMEEEANSFHAMVRQGFLKIAEKFPERVHVIDALGGIEEIHAKILEVIEKCR